MKYILPFLLFGALRLCAQSQVQKISIKGIVTDSADHRPLGFATIVLLNKQTGKPVQSALSKDDGTFEIIGILDQQYKIRLNYIGYAPKELNVPLAGAAGKPIVNLGAIVLTGQSGQLKQVSITAAKPYLKQDIDRLSYDVQADPENKTNDAFEMLRKVPMISIDASDNIKLNGSDSYQIFVNGKPSALMASDPADVLKGIPAATILKIEVITTPPAKYDSEGLSGIINIITVQKKDEGFNGSVFGRYNNTWGERGSITAAAKEGKLGVSAFLGLGHQGMVNTGAGSQIISSTNLLQQGYNLNGGNFRNGNLGLSYEIDSLNLLTATMDFNHRNFDQDQYRTSQLFGGADTLLQHYELTNIGNNTWGVFDLGLNYQLGFKHHKDELLTFSYQYSSFSNSLSNEVTISNPFNYDGSNYNQFNQSGSKENTFQVDFISPVKKMLTVEAGAKAILRDNHSDFESENETITGTLVPDTALTNQFDYHQNVYSVYNSWQLKLNLLTLKAGLRAEHTTVRSVFLAGNAPIDQNYTNLLPAVSVQFSLSQTGSFNAGFTERMQRPSLSQLNPFVNRADPDLIIMGNPALRPILNHLFELSYSNYAKASIRIGLNYAYADNTIQSVTTLLSDTLSQTTYLNIGKNKSAGVNFSLNYPFTDHLNFRLNAQLAHLWMEGVYNASLYQNSAYHGSADASAGYKFADGYYVGATADYFSGNVYLQGRSNSSTYYSIVASKDIDKKRINLSLTIYSPFEPYHESVNTVRTSDFIQSTSQQNIMRNFRIGFNYKFGKMNSDIKTNHRGIKNDDVQNGDNSGNQ